MAEIELTLQTTLGALAKSLNGDEEELLMVPLPVAPGEPPVLVVIAVGKNAEQVERVLDVAMEGLPPHHPYESEKKPARPS